MCFIYTLLNKLQNINQLKGIRNYQQLSFFYIHVGDHERVKVSRIQVRKTTFGHSNSIFGRMNHQQSRKHNDPESDNKYFTEVHRHQRQIKKVLAVDASKGFVLRPQINGKSLGTTLEVIYRYSKVYTLQGTV